MGGKLFNSTGLQAGTEISGTTWRVFVDLRELSDRPLHGLRVLLVADVLRRYVEHVRQSEALLAVLAREVGSADRAAPRAIGIRDPTLLADSPTVAAAGLGGPPCVVLGPDQGRAAPTGPTAGCILGIAGVTTAVRGGNARSTADLFGVHEPLALRLALLRFGLESPAVLSSARLHRAHETLGRWRFKVASWADMPPAPAPPQSIDAIRDALDDLDTGTVLRSLHRLEIDPRVASGSKSATFIYADRVLALDLCHLVGRLRR